MNSFQRRVFHHPLPTSHFDEIDYVHSSYSFPEKLYIILENSSIESAQWAENGICFRIVNEEVFLDKVMPQYFKQTKMTSFQRQLNSYGFRKISRGGESGCYFHPKFQKGRPDLLLVVQRLPAKGSLESYEEVQFSKQKEVSFDYERTNTKKRVRKEKKKTVNKVPHYQKLTTPRGATNGAPIAFFSTTDKEKDMLMDCLALNDEVTPLVNNVDWKYQKLTTLDDSTIYQRFITQYPNPVIEEKIRSYFDLIITLSS